MSRGKHNPGKGQGSDETQGSTQRPFQDALRGWKVQAKTAKVAKPSVKRGNPIPSIPKVQAKSKPAQVDRPELKTERGYEDAVALRQAYQGVRPLDGTDSQPGGRSLRKARPTRPAHVAADDLARERLAAFMSRGLSFRVDVDEDGCVRAHRKGGERALRDPSRLRAAATAEIDLHGFREAEAIRALERFVRDCRREGHSFVRVIHGKGRHSAGRVGVLADATVRALTSDRLAHGVWAFMSEPTGKPPPGALIVALVRQGRSD